MKVITCHSPLHEDLIIEILLRLPVKSLLCFKSVCQRWHAIIISRYFIHNHFHREGNSTGLLVYKDRFSPEEDEHETVYAISSFRGEKLEIYEDKDHSELIGPISSIHGPCNGIFCVFYWTNTLALWNPATRRLRFIPPCPIQGLSTNNLGFGIDPLTDDLQIVLIDGHCKQPHFAVYNLSSNSWRSFEEEALVDSDGHVVVNFRFFVPSFSNGFCYWAKCKSRASLHFVILSFDIYNKSFQEIEMPEIIIKSSLERKISDLYGLSEVSETFKLGLKRRLHCYDGSLALSANHWLDRENFDMWLMKEQGNWTKISTITLPKCHEIEYWNRNQIFAKLMIYDSRNTSNLEFRSRYNVSSIRNLIPFPYKKKALSHCE